MGKWGVHQKIAENIQKCQAPEGNIKKSLFGIQW